MKTKELNLHTILPQSTIIINEKILDNVLELWNQFTGCDSHDCIQIAVSHHRPVLRLVDFQTRKSLLTDVCGPKWRQKFGSRVFKCGNAAADKDPTNSSRRTGLNFSFSKGKIISECSVSKSSSIALNCLWLSALALMRFITDKWVNNMLAIQRSFTQTFLMDDIVKR
ncbi:hypothetical protein CHS0354_010883 [Potamilus streckersoni]|uniref:Uncharacterized protein n=1 Tax=Potamilus streckersoni TaxID=2493646 RepID=A0AAE0VZ80_9BIVA|nr:hypothetical protein CHS0354_010883 [Potamilus streckersoni]